MIFGIEYEFYVHAHFYFTYWYYEKEYGEGIVIANSRTVQLSKCWDRVNVTQLTSFVTSHLPPHILHPHFSLRRHLLLLIALKYRNIIHWRKSEQAQAPTLRDNVVHNEWQCHALVIDNQIENHTIGNNRINIID